MYELLKLTYPGGDVLQPPNYHKLEGGKNLVSLLLKGIDIYNAEGGFLNIESCTFYSEKTIRTLVVDISEGGVSYFNTSFIQSFLQDTLELLLNKDKDVKYWKNSYFNLLGIEVKND